MKSFWKTWKPSAYTQKALIKISISWRCPFKGTAMVMIHEKVPDPDRLPLPELPPNTVAMKRLIVVIFSPDTAGQIRGNVGAPGDWPQLQAHLLLPPLCRGIPNTEQAEQVNFFINTSLGIYDILVWRESYLWLMDPEPDPTPDPTPFFSYFKDAKKIIFLYLFLIIYLQARYL